MTEHKIVIIGGGFAGINLAKSLANTSGIQVVLVDKNNYNHFSPLLYQVATGLLDISSICIPFRTLFKGTKNLNFRLGKLLEVFPGEQKIRLSTGELSYDSLVIATGTVSNFFGMENIKKNALPMKSVEDATKLRNFLLREAEKYTYTNDIDEKRKMQNIVVSGAGPSGVEIAGMLAEMRNRILEKIYPELDSTKMKIYLVDGAATLLPPMREKSQQYSLETLKKMGVKVLLNKMVRDYKDDVVYFKDGEKIETKTLIWTAGVIALKFKGMPEGSYKESKRLKVDAYHRVEHTENIYAIGDACILQEDPNFPNGHPQLGSVAQQQGKLLAKNFKAMVNKQTMQAFTYDDKGTMAIIGRKKAVADLNIPKTTLTGWIAWISWLFVHLLLLLNYRNQLRTMWNWATAYFGKAQSQGIMLGEIPEDESNPQIKEK
ncbi:NAD(P)/FAD-dependent oxidoreductase [Cellulophaga sp. Hel_I_12]|uniref:NAD(P)/FAD-dependent oxidoreductase n=1 Tax=Cellulophaga sp. Hel_I_12 TaxID=1249972 RepID=UPI0006489500|nr:NAD(P)/FAD-dependent oxidoreductase [Cellulophaga sp. Hel_I_12]